MSLPSYREEKRLERERAEKEKARINSDRVVMTGVLEDSKLRAVEKNKYPQSDTGSKSRQTSSKVSASAEKKAETSSSKAGKTVKDPTGKDTEKRAADKKRKQPEETGLPSPRSSCPRLEEKDAKLKGIAKEAP